MQDCARYVEEMTRLRREIHRRPEEGWTEFETQWKVFRALEALGWTIRMGLDVIRPEAVMGRNAELVEKAMVRAAEHGVPESFLKATGGYTGLTADFDTGCEGPVTGFRFDMDCVLVEELHDASHLPAAEGFDSEIPGHMHACGHDAHGRRRRRGRSQLVLRRPCGLQLQDRRGVRREEGLPGHDQDRH